ncbi:MAG: amidase [Acidimicrobiales bacterium]
MSQGLANVWIERFGPSPAGALSTAGPLVAVKDLINVEGSVTTAGCRAVARRGLSASSDAACIARVREAGGRLAGKVNLHELAFGVSGVNPWFGTPPNPADPGRIPGGSSSGSAVAVASGEAEVAIGSDTAGSIRIPAACCGVVGLKTTHGRLPLEGVWPLAPSYDTIGPLAADVAGVVSAMRLLEDGFDPEAASDARVARALFGAGTAIDPVIEEAVSEALCAAELEVTGVQISGWQEAWRHQQLLLSVEALECDGWLLAESGGEGIGSDTLERFRRSSSDPGTIAAARASVAVWVPAFISLVETSGILALPTLPCRPPLIGEKVAGFNVLTAPVSLAGLPAISLPVPCRGRPPTGLQLVAPHGREEQLVSVAARVEAAVALRTDS